MDSETIKEEVFKEFIKHRFTIKTTEEGIDFVNHLTHRQAVRKTKRHFQGKEQHLEILSKY